MVIKSCRNCDIIPILEESISNKDGLNCETVSEWANYVGCETDIRFVSFAIARAGREINKIAHQNTGEYDRIGNNFTHWKDNPHYKVFPKNYKPNNPTDLTKMTTSNPNAVGDYENLNRAFDLDFLKYEVNENLLFNTELLNRCRKECKPINQLVVKYGGEMIKDVLELIDIRTVHPAGKEILNNKTGKTLPKGFQIRVDTNINAEQRNRILNDIWNKYWNPSKPAMVLFRLPEEYQYVGEDGILVVWGIADGSHRFAAASDANQTSVIGWLIEMEVDKIRKFANAELNRVKYGAKDRTNEDIAGSVCVSYRDETSDLYAKIKNAEDGEINQILLDEILTYHVHVKTANAILRAVQHDPNVVVDRKQYDSTRMENYLAEHKIDWIKTKEDYHNYVSGKGVRVIVLQGQGSSHIITAHHICQLQRISDKPITVAFSVDKSSKLTKENAEAERQAFKRKVINTIKVMGEGYKAMFEDLTAVNPSWVCFPELADEFDGGLINLV